MQIVCCFIKAQFFIDHPEFVRMLDSGNPEKQSRRTHICIKVSSNGIDFYVPLRNKLGSDVRKYGRIGHAVPASERPAAGLDFRYALIVSDSNYIEIPQEQRIPNSQYRKLISDASQIEEEFSLYVEGYIKAANKNRINKEPLYRESSLVNFLVELGIKSQ